MKKKTFRLKRRGNDMTKKNYRSLNLDKLDNKKSKIISSQKSLEDISPINWSKDVLLGKKKVLINCNK